MDNRIYGANKPKGINSFKKVFFLIVFISGLSATFAKAQTSSKGLQLIMPSPNAASLGEYGDVPVSKFTGIPNIRIPLYEAKVGAYSIPISISYHAGGIKVAEMASSTGLGWSLNAGGAIIRSKRGNADETEYGFISTGYEIQDGIISPATVFQHTFDSQPDIFSFNFLGHIGKFLYQPIDSLSGRFITIPKQNFIIRYDKKYDKRISKWTIRDDSGILYEFDRYEETESSAVKNDENNEGTGGYQRTAWYLTSVTYPDGTSVEFHYTDPILIKSYSAEYKEQIEVAASDYIFIGSDESKFYARLVNETFAIYLDKIVTPKETIYFETGSREDHEVDKRYTGIRVERNGELIKTIHFNHSYFNPNGSIEEKRLKLDSVNIKGHNNQQGKVYRFDYFEGVLPSRYSLATDHWGYYNGKDLNDKYNYILPEVVVKDVIKGNEATLSLKGADKTSYFDKAKIGTLKRITYPTGGWTDFQYELNTYGYVGNKPIVEFSEEVSKAYVEANEQSEETGSDDTVPVTNEKIFTVPYEQKVKIKIILNPSQTLWSSSHNKYRIPFKITSSGPNVSNSSYFGFNDQENDARIYLSKVGSGDFILKKQIQGDDAELKIYEEYAYLVPGVEYVIRARALGFDDFCSIAVEYGKELSEYQERKGGGLRIKRITSHDGINHQNDKVRTFYYHHKNDVNRSSGAVLGEPKYTHWVKVEKEREADSYFLFRYATSNTTAGPKGAYVVYEHVIEKFGPKEDQGRIEYSFDAIQSSENPTIKPYPYTPFQPLPNYGWKFGQPTLIEVFDSEGNSIKKVQNSYITKYATEVKGLYPKILMTVFDGDDWSPKRFGSVYWYNITTGWKYLSEMKTTIYDSSGNSFTTRTDYTYEDPGHKQLTSKVETNSNGQQRITEYVYAHEVGDEIQVNNLDYSAMQNLNMFTQPYSVTVKNGAGAVLGKHWILWDNSEGWWAPASKWIWEGGNPGQPVFSNN